MKSFTLETEVKVMALHELSAEERTLTEAAREATRRSYAPYSRFHVGAAALLANGVIVTGTNQENVASPSGLCAERTALFHANSQYPDEAIKALAIAGCREEDLPKQDGCAESPSKWASISPCGACRQVMLETENRYNTPMRVLLCGNEEVFVVESARNLLPLAFDNY